jgi:hypothetical protein
VKVFNQRCEKYSLNTRVSYLRSMIWFEICQNKFFKLYIIIYEQWEIYEL